VRDADVADPACGFQAASVREVGIDIDQVVDLHEVDALDTQLRAKGSFICSMPSRSPRVQTFVAVNAKGL